MPRRILTTGCANGVFKCLPCPPTDPTDQLAQLLCGTLAGLEELGSPPCSADDVAQGRFVQAAFPQNASFCAAGGPTLVARGLATSVSCCNDKDLCNALPVAPPLTTPPAPTLRCYQGVDNNVVLQTVTSPRCAVDFAAAG